MDEPNDRPSGAGTCRRVSAWALVRVFWRSLFLQAAWNARGMQNLGFAYALYPALRELYPEPAALAAATERHLTVFNTHPYAAAAIVGGAVAHEERIASGEERPEAVVAFKEALMGPLAALGDGFFWLSLRPACGALAALLSMRVGLWAPVAYLVAYNANHLALRIRFFDQGYGLGARLVDALRAARLSDRGEWLRALAAAASGAVAGLVAAEVVPAELGVPRAAAVVGGWSVFGAAWLLLVRGLSANAVASCGAALALVAGAVF